MPTDDEILERFRELRFKAENVIVREQCALSLAMLEAFIDKAKGDDLEHTMRIYHARVEASLATLERMPDDIWNQWCELPKTEFIPKLAEVYRNFGRDLKLN